MVNNTKNEQYENYVEHLLESIGSFGSFQKKTLLLMILFGAISSINLYVTIFNLAEPKLFCIDTTTNKSVESREVCNVWQNITKSKELGEETSYACEFDKTYYGKSMTTEWNFFCNRKYLASLTQTFHLVGTVSAIFSGYFGDRFGRKRIIIGSLAINFAVLVFFLLLEISSIGLSVTAKYVLYSIAQVFIGSFTYSLYVSSYVLFIEITTHKRLTLFSSLLLSFYVLGELFVLLLAYTIRNFEITYWIVAGVQLATLVLAIFFLRESPRWLISKQKYEEAERLLQKIAIMNGKNMNIKIEAGMFDRRRESDTDSVKNEETNVKALLKQMFYPLANLRKSVLLACVWFSLNLLYYGVSLGVTSIDAVDPYLMYLFSSIAEFLGYMLCFINDKIGRQRTSIGFFTICGAVCLAVAFVPRNTDLDNKKKIVADAVTVIILASFGKAMASAAFNTVYVFTAEYYSTNIRNFALLFISCIGNIGSFLSPQVNLSKTVWKSMPYLIFSLFSLLGSLAIILLPKIKKEKSIQKETEVSRL